jgi:hypothetical protein
MSMFRLLPFAGALVLAYAAAQHGITDPLAWQGALAFDQRSALTTTDVALLGPVKTLTTQGMDSSRHVQLFTLHFDAGGRLTQVTYRDRDGNEVVAYTYHYDHGIYLGYTHRLASYETGVTIKKLDAHHRLLEFDNAGGSPPSYYDITTLDDEGKPLRVERFPGWYDPHRQPSRPRAIATLTYDDHGLLTQRHVTYPGRDGERTQTFAYSHDRPGHPPLLLRMDYLQPANGNWPVPGEAHPAYYGTSHIVELHAYYPGGTPESVTTLRDGILSSVTHYDRDGRETSTRSYLPGSATLGQRTTFSYNVYQPLRSTQFDSNGTPTQRCTYGDRDTYGNWQTRTCQLQDPVHHELSSDYGSVTTRTITYYQ